MPRSNVRLAKLVPWYHERKPRCVTTTVAGYQCRSSASFIQVGHSGTTVCKVHRDMLIIEYDYKFELIREKVVDIQVEATRPLRSVPFKSVGGA